MELLDNDPKSTQNGTKWFCMLINDPMSVLPNELANLDTNSNVGSYNFIKLVNTHSLYFQQCAKNVTLDELEKVSMVFWDLQETLMDSKDDILKMANVTFWTGFQKVEESSNNLDDINNMM